jgi:hypothetical protein
MHALEVIGMTIFVPAGPLPERLLVKKQGMHPEEVHAC